MDDPLSNQTPELSVVIPVYKNAETLMELHKRICTALEGAGTRFEIIFVEDACPQDSLRVLKKITKKDRRVAVLAMSENVGQQKALLAGIRAADGQAVAILDADLQDPPEEIPALLQELKRGYHVVFAGRRGKYEKEARLFSSRIYKWTLHHLGGVPRDAGLFLVMSKELAKRLLLMRAVHPNLVAMIGAARANSISIPVERSKRPGGNSAYTNWMRMKMGILTIAWVIGQRTGFEHGGQEAYRDVRVKEWIGNKFRDGTGVQNDHS